VVITAIVAEASMDAALVAHVVSVMHVGLVGGAASVAPAIVGFRDPRVSVVVAGASDAVPGAPSDMAVEISGAGI